MACIWPGNTPSLQWIRAPAQGRLRPLLRPQLGLRPAWSATRRCRRLSRFRRRRSSDSKSAMTPIYFATGRIPVNPPNPTDFGTDPNPLGTVTFGKALVADASATADLRQPLTLQQTSTGTFWEALQDEIVKGTARTLVLNLHGFDYTFGESIVGAAKLIGWYGGGSP